MKRLVTSSIIAVFALGLVGGAAVAQDHRPHDSAAPQDDHGRPDDHGHDNGPGRGPDGGHGHHRGWHDQSDWRRGGHVAYDDWQSAPPVDYRARHLRRPPHGYEWRQSNGNYVLAAVATGAIISIIANSH
jgi:Ni/Co efflux regulator RcnB